MVFRETPGAGVEWRGKHWSGDEGCHEQEGWCVTHAVGHRGSACTPEVLQACGLRPVQLA